MINKFKEIYDFLNTNWNNSLEISLFSGDLSTILFNLHSFESFNEPVSIDSVINKLEYKLENIVIEDVEPTYGTGIAGFGILIEYIEQKGWVEIDTNEVLGEIDEYLYEKMMSNMKIGNYDFLHGAVGIGNYFLYRLKKKGNIKNYIESLILALDFQADKKDKNFLKWNYFQNDSNVLHKKVFNLGLAHGIPSILVFLIKAHKANILPQKTLSMIQETVNYIQKTKRTEVSITDGSFYPQILSDNYQDYSTTRLAWCYGDLGVCCALWQAAEVLNDTLLKKDIINVLLSASQRRSIEQTKIADAGICHGAAGAAHIFQRFYDWTGELAFKETAEYWYNITLNMATFEDGFAGYKVHIPTKSGGDKPLTSFLEGISGIGLVLLYRISGLDPSWEELLFIR
ncbi:lanthionine synthetase C family protein [Flectobacillus major]|jgi:lantibiotic modifying enzyme|uniref:lanthionine synthetase C family protein n=1 Tax=Flectobacillus major TaxID=103 RepID=UPI000423496A|nr:lanthionine synthetase C family protein [Flectobacillus major]